MALYRAPGNIQLGSEVRWVWLNPSGNVHPMHMHGSYFQVLSTGDAEQSNPVPPSQIRDVSTNFMAVGGTMTTLWKPERTGRWIFHCHILTHISPETSAFHHESMHDGVQHTDPMNHMARPGHGNHDSAARMESLWSMNPRRRNASSSW